MPSRSLLASTEVTLSLSKALRSPGCRAQNSRWFRRQPNGLFRGIGVVTDIHPATGSLTVNHEEIPGLMPPMEMLFRVNPRTLSDGVRPGDKVESSVEGKTYTIPDIRVVEHAK